MLETDLFRSLKTSYRENIKSKSGSMFYTYIYNSNVEQDARAENIYP